MYKRYFQLFSENPLLVANSSEYRDSAKMLKFGKSSS